MIQEKIITIANLFKGIKEVGNNEGWEDIFFPEFKMTFLELMQLTGWKKGEAWCVYAAELIWKLAYTSYDSNMVNVLDKLFSANAVQTFYNFVGSNDFIVSRYPSKGSIIIFQKYKNGVETIYGHAGIVKAYEGDVITSIDGNTNAKGYRNGDTVREVCRLIDWKKENGLRPLGFIHPKSV